MTANAEDTVLAVAGQAGEVARAIEGEVEVGVGLITRWYAVPHLCEGGLQETNECIPLWITILQLYCSLLQPLRYMHMNPMNHAKRHCTATCEHNVQMCFLVSTSCKITFERTECAALLTSTCASRLKLHAQRTVQQV